MRDSREEAVKYANKIMELESAISAWMPLPARDWPFNRRNAMRRLRRYKQRLAELKGE